MTALSLRRLWLAVGWGGVGLVVYLSLTPNPPDMAAVGGDKGGHLAAYGTLMLWFAQALRARARLQCAAALVLLGLALEGLQGLSATRSLDALDALANGAGVLLGLGLAWLRVDGVLASATQALTRD